MGLYENNNGTLDLLAGGTLYADSPIGSIIPFGGSIAPSGYLLCNGAAVSRTTYGDLFAVIGTAFGAGDGSTTFNVPDLRGKVTVGYNSSETEFNAVGKTGGEKTHQLTVTEIPTHNHRVCPNGVVNTSTGSGGYGARSWLSSGEPYNVTTEPIGGNGAHNNLQPYSTVNYIIKATTIALPTDFEAAVDAKLELKQDKTDNNLTTTAKTVVGAINELNNDLTKNTYSSTTNLLTHVGSTVVASHDGWLYVAGGTSAGVVYVDDADGNRVGACGGTNAHVIMPIKKGFRMAVYSYSLPQVATFYD